MVEVEEEQQSKRGRKKVSCADRRVIRCVLCVSQEEAAVFLSYLKHIAQKNNIKRFSPTQYVLGIALGLEDVSNLYKLESRTRRNPLYPIYATSAEWAIVKEKAERFGLSVNDYLVRSALAGPSYWTNLKKQ